jgi:transposase
LSKGKKYRFSNKEIASRLAVSSNTVYRKIKEFEVNGTISLKRKSKYMAKTPVEKCKHIRKKKKGYKRGYLDLEKVLEMNRLFYEF